MKKLSKRLFSSLLGLVMLFALLPSTAFAANWNPTDKITITVRVFDQTTGAYYVVGTDTCTKGDQYIQSDAYKIPQLTQFVDSSKFGSVVKVVGNWYFPSGDSSQGATVNWSCNSSTATMTYWVTSYNPAGNSSGGTQGDTGTVPSGAVWTFNLKYDLAGGTNSGSFPTQTYGTTSKYEKSHTFATHSVVPVREGYVFQYWQQSGSISTNRALGEKTMVSAASISGYTGGTVTDTLTAVWEKVESTPATSVTLTYVNGSDVLSTQTFLAGDTVNVSDCSAVKDGYTFAGWDTSASATTVVYKAGATFVVNSNTTLYAVWQEEPKDPEVAGYSTYNITKVFQGDYTQAPKGFGMTYSYTDLATNQTVTGTVELTAQDDGSLKGTISVPYYKNVATGTTYNLVLTETNADVDGYDLSISGNGGTVSGNTVTYAASATIESTWNRTITNTYIKKDVPADQYTVTYTDGVADESLFDDQSYVVEAGGSTPGFEGTPSREGYTFVGWSPAVSPTVTENIVYTAQWTKNGDDDNEKISEPGMDKKAGGQDTIGAVTPGQSITFTLNSHVGQDMADQWDENNGWDNASYDLVFHDTLTGPISFQNDSLSVTIGGKTLSDTYYELDADTDGKGFTLTVDCVAALKASVFEEEDIGRAAVVVTYSAVVDEEAADGAEILNEAYVNNSATDTVTGEVDGDTPPTPPTPPHTGGAGTLAFTTLGLTLMCGAAAAFVVRRKRA